MTARIPVRTTGHPPLWQRIAQKATQLCLLGMSYKEIGKALHVSPSLARKTDWSMCNSRHRKFYTNWTFTSLPRAWASLTIVRSERLPLRGLSIREIVC